MGLLGALVIFRQIASLLISANIRIAFAVDEMGLSSNSLSRERSLDHRGAGSRTIHHVRDRQNVCMTNHGPVRAIPRIWDLLSIDRLKGLQ